MPNQHMKIDEISARVLIFIFMLVLNQLIIFGKRIRKIGKVNNVKIKIKSYNKTIKFKKGVINIIEHDGLRKYKNPY